MATTIGIGIFGVHPASAGPIDPGFDLFATAPGTSAVTIDRDPGPSVDLVTVALKGVPLGPALDPVGDTDTIVARKNPAPIPPQPMPSSPSSWSPSRWRA